MWTVLLVIAATVGPTIFIDGPPKIVSAVEARLKAEGSRLTFTHSATAASDRFRIERQRGRWWLFGPEPRLAAAPRPIGRTENVPAASRIAALLILEHLKTPTATSAAVRDEDRGRPQHPRQAPSDGLLPKTKRTPSPPSQPRPKTGRKRSPDRALGRIPAPDDAVNASAEQRMPATTQAKDIPPTQATDTPGGNEAPPPSDGTDHRAPVWQAEAGALALRWPGAFRAGLTAAAQRRLFSRVRGGIRTFAAGFCCDTEVSNIRYDGWTVGALLEASGVYRIDAVDLEGAVGVGLAYETVRAQVVDLFEGPTVPEQRQWFDVVGRAAGGGRWRPIPWLQLWLRGGVFVHPSRFVVRLPEPYANGRAPAERGQIVPFVELGAGFIFSQRP